MSYNLQDLSNNDLCFTLEKLIYALSFRGVSSTVSLHFLLESEVGYVPMLLIFTTLLLFLNGKLHVGGGMDGSNTPNIFKRMVQHFGKYFTFLQSVECPYAKYANKLI